MRWLLVLMLASCAWAQPTANQASGGLSQSQPVSVAIDGKFFQGEARIEAVTDLREARQYRFTLTMKAPKTKACWAAHVVLLDANNRVVGACSYNQGSATNSVEFQEDIGMPDLGAARKYQLVIYEDTKPIGAR